MERGVFSHRSSGQRVSGPRDLTSRVRYSSVSDSTVKHSQSVHRLEATSRSVSTEQDRDMRPEETMMKMMMEVTGLSHDTCGEINPVQEGQPVNILWTAGLLKVMEDLWKPQEEAVALIIPQQRRYV
ncbi:hypothetical protein E1301_Tti005472 [Triplophysa tibetana]|uniref:Uncharacterized protein n=1 Tax=Triplophysa tibetana TaxID=1572043 RepID=A0A5A9NEZ6_9TELE|nr:hypothetical protein E1301_Tti005472 [Triplophysa tibetana]